MPETDSDSISVRMKKSELMTILQELDTFSAPKMFLEQYPTDSVAASDWIMHMVAETQDLQKSLVVDLGCGTGTLTAGLLMMGVPYIIAIDIDSDALDICKKNLSKLGLDKNVLLLQKNIKEWTEEDSKKIFDIKQTSDLSKITVVSNPPFGTKQKGSDLKFLESALKFADVIYSLHLAVDTNRTFLQKKIPQIGGRITAVHQLYLYLKATYGHHIQKNRRILTDLYRIEKFY